MITVYNLNNERPIRPARWSFPLPAPRIPARPEALHALFFATQQRAVPDDPRIPAGSDEHAALQLQPGCGATQRPQAQDIRTRAALALARGGTAEDQSAGEPAGHLPCQLQCRDRECA